MISHEYKCIFIHQRKCAGTSIIRSFGLTPEDTDWHLFNDGTLSEEWAMKDKIAKGYLIFTVVRNPWDRFVSGWKYLPKYKKLTLDETIRNLPVEGHDYRHLTRPQLDTLIDKSNRFVPNVVIRYEHLHEGFQALCARLGKPFNLAKMNETVHSGIEEYETREQIEFIRKHFQKDIDYFGYSFR